MTVEKDEHAENGKEDEDLIRNIDKVVEAGRAARTMISSASYREGPNAPKESDQEQMFRALCDVLAAISNQLNHRISELKSSQVEHLFTVEMNKSTVLNRFLEDFFKNPSKANSDAFQKMYNQATPRSIVHTLFGILEKEASNPMNRRETARLWTDIMEDVFQRLAFIESYAKGLFGGDHEEELGVVLARINEFRSTMRQWREYEVEKVAAPAGIFDVYTRYCTARIENKTKSYYNFQLIHKFTGKAQNASNWIVVAPGQSKWILNIEYYTGTFVMGKDNFKVFGNELYEVLPEPGKTTPIEHDGKYFVEGQKWKFSTLDDWKVHCLRSEDEGRDTIVRVYEKDVYFVSESGTSSEGLYTNGSDFF